MKLDEVISQLYDLKYNSMDFIDEDNLDDETDVWNKDIVALDIAIEILEKELCKEKLSIFSSIKILFKEGLSQINNIAEEREKFKKRKLEMERQRKEFKEDYEKIKKKFEV